jgi:hypothetical protein
MDEHIKVIRFKMKSLLGVFEHSKHESETRTAKNKMAEPINVKIYVFRPLLDEIQS